MELLLMLLAPPAVAVPPPRFTSFWPAPTNALPNQLLPDVPLLGNGHIGVLMDTHTDGASAGHTGRSFAIRPATRCNAVYAHTGKILGLNLRQCEQRCIKSPSCAVFSFGEAGSCVRTPKSCCFAQEDTSQCTPGVPGYTSGIRSPNPPAPVGPRGVNATVNLQVGSNAMWALRACDNSSASAPLGPQWRPAQAAACGQRIALGGLKVRLPIGGGHVLNVSSEQHMSTTPHVVARLAIDGTHGLVVSSAMHPTQNLLVTNLTAGASAIVGVTLSTWAVSSASSPSVASLARGGGVGLVTRRAIANDSALPQAKHIVAALASSSPLSSSSSPGPAGLLLHWELVPTGEAAAGTVEARAKLTLTPNQTVSIFTAFADNSLNRSLGRPDTAAHVAAAASLAAATAASTPGTAAALAHAVQHWWSGFWQRSAVVLPESPYVERYWYDSNYVTASMASTNPQVPAPGLFGPWVTLDHPAFGGDYTLDYNYEASFYGVYSSNHPEQAASYFGPVLAYQPVASKLAHLIARKLNLSGAACNASLHFPAGMGPWGFQDIDTHIYMHWCDHACKRGCYRRARLLITYLLPSLRCCAGMVILLRCCFSTSMST